LRVRRYWWKIFFEKSYFRITLGFMLKKMLLRKMLKSQMKDVPVEQQEMLLGGFEKNPELFEKIAKETKEKTKEGKDQMTAAMEVMQKYQQELAEAFKKN